MRTASAVSLREGCRRKRTPEAGAPGSKSRQLWAAVRATKPGWQARDRRAIRVNRGARTPQKVDKALQLECGTTAGMNALRECCLPLAIPHCRRGARKRPARSHRSISDGDTAQRACVTCSGPAARNARPPYLWATPAGLCLSSYSHGYPYVSLLH